MSKAVYWFRNDLRLHDQPILSTLSEVKELLPIHIVNEQLFIINKYGFTNAGVFRLKFLMENLRDLKSQLRQKGIDLLVFIGKPAEIFKKIGKTYNFSGIFAQKEHTTYEIADESEIDHNFANKLYLHEGLTLVNPHKTPFSLEKLPHVFTAFRKKVEKVDCINNVSDDFSELPSLPNINLKDDFLDNRLQIEIDLDGRTAFPYGGGETSALQHLKNYVWDKQLISTYKNTRNGLIGTDYSSKLSAWLANGSISPRKVYVEVKRFEKEVIKNSSTYWLIFELLWRDFFRFTAMKYGKSMFMKKGINNVDLYEPSKSKTWFNKWRNGETGQPFVDANMKELLYTGFMSNRGRQIVASYLCNDLKLNWQIGAKWFENRLIDYDPCSNYGNWQYIAGVGNDPRKDRYFNTEIQAKKHDPQGKYQQLWRN